MVAKLDLEHGSSKVSFTWAGFSEIGELNGAESAELLVDSLVMIGFNCHLDNAAAFKA